MEFKIFFTGDRFDVKLSGKSSVEDCKKYFAQLTSHEHWKPGSAVFSDETELELNHLSADEIGTMADICRNYKDVIGTARFAAYVKSDFIYGMNRMFEAHAEIEWDAVIRAFKNRSDALAWLSDKS